VPTAKEIKKKSSNGSEEGSELIALGARNRAPAS
jgi:hypothetical protein